jgi:hypothetical protein
MVFNLSQLNLFQRMKIKFQIGTRIFLRIQATILFRVPSPCALVPRMNMAEAVIARSPCLSPPDGRMLAHARILV